MMPAFPRPMNTKPKPSSLPPVSTYDYGTELNDEADTYMGDGNCPVPVGWLEGPFLPTGSPFNIRRPHGLVNKVLSYIERRAVFDQPQLNLFSAVVTCSTLMAGKISTPNGDVLSILAMGLAPSSAGKDAGVSSPKELLVALGLKSLLLGKQGSKQALEKSMSANPTRLMILDEVGHSLLSASKCQFASQVAPTITEIWNGKHYLGSGAAGRETWDCERPNLSAYVTGSPELVYEASSDAQVSDGGLPRWLLARGERKDIREKLEREEDVVADQALYAELQAWMTSTMSESIFTATTPGGAKPPCASITKEAEELLDLHEMQYCDYAGQVKQHGELYNKANQVAIRVATIHAAGRADHPKNAKIEIQDAQFAIEMIGVSMRNYTEFIKGMNTTERSENLEEILEIIRKYGRDGVDHSELVRKIANKFVQKQREELLNTLIESRCIIKQAVGRSTHYFSVPGTDL